MSKSPLQITESAIARVKVLIDKREDDNWMLRVTILGGGCSGFQYRIGLDNEVKDDDQIYDEGDIKLIVDESSKPLLEGTTLDYVEELIGASFQLKNPNAASSCGCGNSFSV